MSRNIWWVVLLACMENKGNTCKIPLGELEGNRQFGRRSSKRKDITMVKEVELEDVD
jgi:hypothetical protein